MRVFVSWAALLSRTPLTDLLCLDFTTYSAGNAVTHECLHYKWIKMFCSRANNARTCCTQKGISQGKGMALVIRVFLWSAADVKLELTQTSCAMIQQIYSPKREVIIVLLSHFYCESGLPCKIQAVKIPETHQVFTMTACFFPLFSLRDK